MQQKPVVLETIDIKKSFDQLEVLKGITLEAKEGEVVTILGSSGSGKSTFLRCINYLETPSSGTIKVCGEEITPEFSANGQLTKETQKQIINIRKNLAMVFQQFNLWNHLTLIENVIEAPVHVLKIPKKEALESAEYYLDKVGIFEKKDSYPIQLSGGQQQRAGIARALAIEPKVLMFDEPTSALDPELVGEVLAVMKQLARDGRTMLVVTHELNFAKEVSDQVVYFSEGIIEEKNNPKDFFKNPKSAKLEKFLKYHLNG